MSLDKLLEEAVLNNETNASAKVKKENLDSIIHKLESLGFKTEVENKDKDLVSLKVEW